MARKPCGQASLQLDSSAPLWSGWGGNLRYFGFRRLGKRPSLAEGDNVFS